MVVTETLETAPMDIDALHSALLSLTVLPEQIRAVRENGGAGNDGPPVAFGEFLNSLERDLRIAKATLARELDFPLCQCCWPPELLATDVNGRTHCPGSRKAVSSSLFAKKQGQSVTSARPVSKSGRVDRFTRAQKDKLLRLRDTLVDSFCGLANGNLRARADGSEARAFIGDRADAGSDESERDFVMTLLSQEHEALTEIDQALNRIESGTYGVCEISGKPIPRRRLEAIPFARYTVECQTQFEEKRKAFKSRQRVPALAEANIVEEEPGEAEQEEVPARGRRRKAGLTQRISLCDAERFDVKSATLSLSEAHVWNQKLNA